MFRNLLAVVVGYLAIFLAVFLLLTGAYLAFGTEHAFEPGSYKTSVLWCLTSLALGLPAAWLGGWMCTKIAHSRGPVIALAIVVGVLGLLVAIPTLATPPGSEARPGNLPNLEAMMKAQTPAWVAFLNPIIGVAGVLAGGRKGAKTPAPTTD